MFKNDHALISESSNNTNYNKYSNIYDSSLNKNIPKLNIPHFAIDNNIKERNQNFNISHNFDSNYQKYSNVNFSIKKSINNLNSPNKNHIHQP